MIKKIFLIFIILGFASGFGLAQTFIKTSELFQRPVNNFRTGRLNIVQDSAIDSLISRHILINKNLAVTNDHPGIDGFRIQIYRSSNINAREESIKAETEFIREFPDINSDRLYDEPGWFMVRVGDFRTRTEATKLYLMISKKFRDAYIVPDFICFPDLNTK